MKTILHLCADLDSDSRPYQLNSSYKVILLYAAFQLVIIFFTFI